MEKATGQRRVNNAPSGEVQPAPARKHWLAALVVMLLPVVAVVWGRLNNDQIPDAALQISSAAPDPSRLRALLGDAATAPSVDTAPAESALRPLRATLALPPRSWSSQSLAFAGNRVARVVDTGIEIVTLAGSPGGATRATVPTSGIHALFELGASLGALLDGRVLLFDPGKNQPRRLPGVAWLPYARVFPDLISRSHLMVLDQPSHTIYRYRLDSENSPLLPLVAYHELPDFDEKLFVALRDGSFLYSSGDSFTRLYTSGLTKRLAKKSRHATPLRALRAERIDQVFVLYDDGVVERVHLSDGMRVLWSTKLTQVPFDLIASHDELVLLEDTPGQRRAWRLRVVGPERKEPLVIELGESDESGENWAQVLHHRLGLAVSRGRVAVVGPGGLGVWKLSNGERLLGPP